jgi:outer membrane receptor for ferric coprogen and ferric-rhodotorulic acid
MSKSGGVKGLLCFWALSLVWSCGTAQPGRDDIAMKYRLHIASEPLDQALQDLASQSGIQIVFFSKLTEGRRAQALDGLYTISAALDILLARSNLTYRMIGPTTFQVSLKFPTNGKNEAPPGRETRQTVASSDASDKLEEVTVTGTAEHLAATRIATPLSEIPQTIAIISAEQISQQTDTDLTDALRYASGITVVQLDSLNNADFYSRGFQITTFHLDGGAALSSFGSVPGYSPTFLSSPDLSEIDHIEVLRGSDALFGGLGNPGGTVSLVRKVPLDTFTCNANLSTGSWNNDRAEADVTGPLALDGALRGRLDGVFEDRDFFYDLATLERKRLFGVVEYDVTPATLVRVGGSYQRDDALPVVNGLPRAPDGSDPHLPIDTAMTFYWSRFRERMREGYLQVQQKLIGDWALKINAEQWDGTTTADYGYWGTPIDPSSRAFYSPPASQVNIADGLQRQWALDMTVTGTFSWFGRRAEVAFGGDYMYVHLTDPTNSYMENDAVPGPTPIYPYNPALYPSPFFSSVPLGTDVRGDIRTHGVFASLRIPLTQALSITAGTRLGSDETRDNSILTIAGQSYPESASYGVTNVFTPYVGAMYALDDHYSVYASYADIYQNQGEAQKQSNGRLIGPESGVDREIGIKTDWYQHTLNGNFVLYKITQDSVPLNAPNPLLDASGPPYCCYLPGTSRSYGADVEFNGTPSPGWLLTMGYSYNVNEAATGGAVSVVTPRHVLKLWASKELPGALDRFTVGGGLLAQSANSVEGCSSPTGICPTTAGIYQILQDSYAVVDLRATFRLNSHWQAALTVNNLFDRTYYQALGTLSKGNWYGDPRNLQLRIQGKY